MDRPSSLGRQRSGFQFGAYLTKELILQGTIWIIYLLQLTTTLDSRIRGISGCYGNSITLTCMEPEEVIIVHSLRVGSKPLKKWANCTQHKPPRDCCTMDKDNDCVYNYKSKVSTDKHEFRVCQGKLDECPMKVMWTQNDGKCSSSKYPKTTNYMLANYMCANKNNVMDMCGPSGMSSITSNATIHLRNYRYPNLVQNSRNCVCNISTVNSQRSHVVRVKAVDVLINCSQYLVFSDQTNARKDVECEKALYGLSNVYSSEGNKPELQMRYQTNESSIYLWVEISVEGPENNQIRVVCQNMSEDYRLPAELVDKSDTGGNKSKGTPGTIHTTTQQISASSSSRKGGTSYNDPKVIGGIIAGLFLAAMLIVMLIFVWKRKRSVGGGAEPLKYSADTNPYDNFNDNPAFEEAIYDTIPDNIAGSGKVTQLDSSMSESVRNHAYESLKKNGGTLNPYRSDITSNGSDCGSDTSLPKEPAPLPPTPDLFRRLPSIPKEEIGASKTESPTETYDVIQERLDVPEDRFLESARSSTQTMLETLTSSDPDLSRESLCNPSPSSSKSEPIKEHSGPTVIVIDGKSAKINIDTATPAAGNASPLNSGAQKVLPGPAIYHDTE